MKEGKVVVDRIRVEHRHFRSNRKRQSLEIGSYTVTSSSEYASFQRLLSYIRAVKAVVFLETIYKTLLEARAEKRS